jgi:hypothetical protein
MWRCINRRINNVTLIEQIQRDEDTQMYVDTTGVCGIASGIRKALACRRNDV